MDSGKKNDILGYFSHNDRGVVIQKPFTICGGSETIHHLRWCRNHSLIAMVHKPFTICGGTETIHHLWWCINDSPFALVQKQFTVCGGAEALNDQTQSSFGIVCRA